MTSRYAALSREQLATLVPELLLIGQLIDRSGMAWCISAFGRESMAEIAIEEWAASSPIYTRRMQRALGYAPAEPGTGDVVTIFKGLQLDIGALIGRYGSDAKKLARTFLDDGLYGIGATDLHGPVGAREWVGKSLKELRSRAGDRAFEQLMSTIPGRILRGESLET